MCNWRPLHLHGACRIGEAVKPGPDAWLTLNVGSWGKHWEWLKCQEQEMIMVQEHLLLPGKLEAAKQAAKESGWRLLADPATPGPHGRPTGGLGCLIRRGRQAHRIPLQGLPEEAQGRLMAVAINMGAYTFVVANVYGHDCGQPNARARNAALRAEVASLAAACGEAPFAVAGDHQDPPQQAYGQWLGVSLWDVAARMQPNMLVAK